LDRRFIVITVLASFGLALGSVLLSSGCSDESKTTGTQVQISPEVKEQLDDMRSAQKEVRAERKAERAAGRLKGR
jgi:hypothetical protein